MITYENKGVINSVTYDKKITLENCIAGALGVIS